MSTRANSKNVRQLRIERGLSQEELAEKSQLGHRTIQRIEEGGAVRPSTLGAVAKSLDVSIPEIVAPAADTAQSLLAVHHAVQTKLAKLVAGEAKGANSDFAVEVLEIAQMSDDDDDHESPIVLSIQQYLRALGYKTSQGAWDDTRLLAKRPRIGDELFIIHRANAGLASQLMKTLTSLHLGMSVVILSAAEVSRRSVTIPVGEVLGQQHALVAYRPGR